MREATIYTRDGSIKVNDAMSDAELAALGVADKSMLFPEVGNPIEEIASLKRRVAKLEKQRGAP